MKNILTVFAGRKSSMEILLKYLKKAIQMGILHEVHLWNYARKTEDEKYIRDISNLKRTTRNNQEFIQFYPPINGGATEFQLTASHEINPVNIHPPDVPTVEPTIIFFKMCLSTGDELEIILHQDIYPSVVNWLAISNNKVIWEYTITDMEEGEEREPIPAPAPAPAPAHPQNIRISTEPATSTIHIEFGGHTLSFQWDKLHQKNRWTTIWTKAHQETAYEYDTSQSPNKGIFLMDGCEKKNWCDYYQYYTPNHTTHENDVIIKCDDNIVFIDIHKLDSFIQFVREDNSYDCIFANTINNGVSAYFQQHIFNLIPLSLMKLEYPKNGLCGSLWESGKKATALHKYFLRHKDEFLQYGKVTYRDGDCPILPIPTRFSINFFGIQRKKWGEIKDCGLDDELNLTVEYVKSGVLTNAIYSGLFVSHLSFYKQEEDGAFERIHLLELYGGLADTYCC
jgi:hypothetical protein